MVVCVQSVQFDDLWWEKSLGLDNCHVAGKWKSWAFLQAGAFQGRLGCDAKKANPKGQENKSRLVETVYLADLVTDLTCQIH